METCENCRRNIGNLETPRLFKGSVVCAECEVRLKNPLPYETPSNQKTERQRKNSQLIVWSTVSTCISMVLIGIGMRINADAHYWERDAGMGWGMVGFIGVIVSLIVFIVGRLKA